MQHGNRRSQSLGRPPPLEHHTNSPYNNNNNNNNNNPRLHHNHRLQHPTQPDASTDHSIHAQSRHPTTTAPHCDDDPSIAPVRRKRPRHWSSRPQPGLIVEDSNDVQQHNNNNNNNNNAHDHDDDDDDDDDRSVASVHTKRRRIWLTTRPQRHHQAGLICEDSNINPQAAHDTSTDDSIQGESHHHHHHRPPRTVIATDRDDRVAVTQQQQRRGMTSRQSQEIGTRKPKIRDPHYNATTTMYNNNDDGQSDDQDDSDDDDQVDNDIESSSESDEDDDDDNDDDDEQAHDNDSRAFVADVLSGEEMLTNEEFLCGATKLLQSSNDVLKKYGLPCADDDVSAFYGVDIATIPTHAYLDRLLKYTDSSPATFVVMLILIQRIGRLRPTMQPNEYNVHRVAITALMIACKVVDNRVFRTSHYARVGGVPCPREMATLEQVFLRFVKWNVFVDDVQFRECVRLIKAKAAAVGGSDSSNIESSIQTATIPLHGHTG